MFPKREAQTFNLVMCGKTTREIAIELGVSIHTAAHYRRRVYEKLEVRNVAGVIRCAAHAGWFATAENELSAEAV